MTSPMMVVGRETSLASGAIDLVGLARSGELLLIEFKTGPQNPDFRQVIAQLLDYGSDIWQMPFDEFQAVARRYFASDRCQEALTKGRLTLVEAARSYWTGLTDAEETLLHERVADQLEHGAFHYIAVAQRFSPTMERTVQYLNATMPSARFYAVEVVRFAVGPTSTLGAFEARTVLKPSNDRAITIRQRLDEEQILESIDDETSAMSLSSGNTAWTPLVRKAAGSENMVVNWWSKAVTWAGVRGRGLARSAASCTRSGGQVAGRWSCTTRSPAWRPTRRPQPTRSS